MTEKKEGKIKKGRIEKTQKERRNRGDERKRKTKVEGSRGAKREETNKENY